MVTKASDGHNFLDSHQFAAEKQQHKHRNSSNRIDIYSNETDLEGCFQELLSDHKFTVKEHTATVEDSNLMDVSLANKVGALQCTMGIHKLECGKKLHDDFIFSCPAARTF